MTTSTRHRGIYLLPNLFTTAGIFLGFFAIISSIKGHFSSAAICILLAMITDSLDGRIARITDTQTAFGAEYDSLSDMVVFGLAPPIVLYLWTLAKLDEIGWLIAFIYSACTALRLARFNTQVTTGDKRFFQGLACTPSAGVIAAIVWLQHAYHLEFPVFSALISLFLSICMVSNIRYRSFKEIDTKDKVSFTVLIFIVMLFVAIAANPPFVIFSIFFLYALSGPWQTLIDKKRMRKIRKSRRSSSHARK